MAKNNFYAYQLPNGESGVTSAWPETERKVKGVIDAHYRGFKTKEEAEEWLDAGAKYAPRIRTKLKKGIYFDAGTGRGQGVEISVTDEKGDNLLHKALPAKKINPHGKHLLSPDATNNYGELLACRYAMQLAIKHNIKNIFGDSRLVLNYWSRGFTKRKDLPPATLKLIQTTARLRKKFEAAGGKLAYVPGGDNPADLGFHR